MKTVIPTLFLIVLCSFGLSSQAQNNGSSKLERNIPLIVTETFNNSYPANDAVWFSRYQGYNNQQLVYIAKFIFDNRYCHASYTADGRQQAFAATVDRKELPKGVTQYMKENYPTFPIIEALLVTDNKQQVTYEIGVYIDNDYVVFVFTEAGDFMRNTKA